MNQKLFENGLSSLGGTATEIQINQFKAYSSLLKEWNTKMNLTAIVDDDGITIKHFLDSILPLYHIDFPQAAKLADIGTGAGFPGLPIKIMRPDLDISLIDSLQKRIGFLREVCSALDINETECIHGRAEEMGKNKEYREKYDIVISRAVSNLKILCEYCLPFIKTGGMFVALKSDNINDELADARPMIGVLGGAVEKITDAALPESDIMRKLIIIRKEKNTPPQFPRRTNKIKSGK